MTYRRMPARPPRAVLGSVVLAGVVLLAGCNGDAEPVPTPSTEVATTPVETATPEPTPTQTATETATAEPTETSALPPLPEEATQNTPEGAEAFIRYYFDVVNRAHTAPESGLIEEISLPECQSCSALEETVTQLERDAQRARSGPYDLTSLAPIGGTFGELTLFNAEVHLPANAILDSADNVVREGGASDRRGEVAVTWREGRWLLHGLALSPA